MDIIIIGGGIAGLYSAYKILKMKPDVKLLIIERDKLGGRIGTEMFQGTRVMTGAGIGRKNKDHLLNDLLKELNIPVTTFVSSRKYAQLSCNVKKIFHLLKKRFAETRPKKTFKQFALPLLGNEMYKNFVVCSGYTDYENEDAYETFYNYGFEDNFSDFTGVSIPWNLLIDALVKKIGRHFCFANVTKIKASDNFTVYTNKGNYSCDKIILATAIDTVQKLLPLPIYRQIHGQSFLRVYGKFTKASTKIINRYVDGYTIVAGPLKKIIPMNKEKGVFMIAYSDNEDADLLKKHSNNTPKNRDYFCKLVENALGIPETLDLIAIKDFYWKIGTHYYEPLRGNRKEFIKRAQHPFPGILVVGELISTNQGWVEGALESTEAVNKKWVDNI